MCYVAEMLYICKIITILVMLYYFVINAKPDILANMGPDFESKIHSIKVPHQIYYTKGAGDATRFVRIYCDLHKAEEVCFVACGGSGTLAQVASGVVGFQNKSIACLAYGSTNDFCKHFPGRDFTSIDAMLNGTVRQIDIIKANNFYSLNVANAGVDSMVQYTGNLNIEKGMDAKKAYSRAALQCMLLYRLNKIKIKADGKPLNRKYMMFCNMANASWYGGKYNCAPRAEVDDGLMEVMVARFSPVVIFLRILKFFEKGTHLEDPACMSHIKYVRAKHIELDSKDLIYLCLDGEQIPSTHFDIEVLPREISMVIP